MIKKKEGPIGPSFNFLFRNLSVESQQLDVLLFLS